MDAKKWAREVSPCSCDPDEAALRCWEGEDDRGKWCWPCLLAETIATAIEAAEQAARKEQRLECESHAGANQEFGRIEGRRAAFGEAAAHCEAEAVSNTAADCMDEADAHHESAAHFRALADGE